MTSPEQEQHTDLVNRLSVLRFGVDDYLANQSTTFSDSWLALQQARALAAAIGQPDQTFKGAETGSPTGWYGVLERHRPDLDGFCPPCDSYPNGTGVRWIDCPEIAVIRQALEAAQ